MTVFNRDGHWRTNENGTTFWVRGHKVRRDHWDIQGLQSQFGSAIYRSSDFLRRNNVGHGVQGCFVNPNAKCPECGVPVFFYANSFGSRVYFDELGPPWPKHPCTDHPRPTRPIIHPDWMPITTRKKGLIREIIDCANQSGLLRRKEFGVRNADEWTLLVVEEVKRSGEHEEILASIIDSLEAQSVQFSCFSAEPFFEPGDFVSTKGREYSFFDRRTMQAYSFRDGDRLRAHEDGSSVAPSSAHQPPLAAKVASTASAEEASATKAPFRPFEPSHFRRRDMSREEKAQIPIKLRTNRGYRKLWVSKIRLMIKEGARTPEHFAVRLNAMGSLTANKTPWTPRLARFLVSYVIEGEKFFQVVHKSSQSMSIEILFGPGLRYEELLSRSMPHINRLQKKGVFAPEAIAVQLNREGLVPAKGLQWTAKSIGLLLSLQELGITTDAQVRQVFLEAGQMYSSTSYDAPVHEIKDPLAVEEMAKRLQSLGRVSIKDKNS